MTTHFCIPPFLAGSAVEARLLDVHALYEELNSHIREWQVSSALECPAGCGICCVPYEPHVLPLEGAAVAAFLIQTGREQALSSAGPLEEQRPGCLLYDPASPAHCTVYAARPLECRLFGFAGLPDKTGSLTFRLCRHMSWARPRLMSGQELRAAGLTLPPAMDHYSARLRALSPTDGTAPLGAQVRSALSHLLLLRGYRPSISALGPDGSAPHLPRTPPARRPRRRYRKAG